MVRSMTLDLFFDFLAIKLNGPKADGKHLIFNFNFTDVKEKWLVEMVNGVLNNTKNIQSKKADATFTLKRETLNQIILKELTSKDAIAQKKIKISGDESKLKELISYLDKFDTWFNIVTP